MYFKSENITIAGIAAAVPKNKKTAKDFMQVFDEETVHKFMKNTGIRMVRQALPEQTAGDLGYEAASQLLERMQVSREQIGVVAFVTQSPDYRRPATACVLHKRLELSQECAAFDVGLGCSGFVYGHQIVEAFMMTSEMPYGLLILGETASKLVNPKDKSIAMMFGDAGAAVLYKRENGHAHTTLLRSDGSRFQSIILPAGGFRDMYPPKKTHVCSDGIERSKYDIFMDGVAVFAFSISDIPVAIHDYLDKTGTDIKDYKKIILHQANQFIVKQIGKKFNVEKERLPMVLDRYGNVGGISIPLTLCDCYGAAENVKERILASGFGIGLSWGVTSFSVDSTHIYPVFETDNYYKEGKIELETM